MNENRLIVTVFYMAFVMASPLVSSESNTTERAALPYAFAYKLATEHDPMSPTNGILTIKIESVLPQVKPKDIELYIDSKTGRIPLSLSSNGVCVIPVSAELCHENPYIRANQPRGSMLLTALGDLSIRVPVERKLPYRELMKTVELAQRVKSTQPKEVVDSGYMAALVVQIRDGRGGNIVVHTAKEDTMFTPKPGDIYTVPYRLDWMEENPDVLLPGRSVQMVPLDPRIRKSPNKAPEDTARKLADPQR